MIPYKSKATSANLNAAFVSRKENTDVEGILTSTNATNATSSTDGAIQTAGGVGIEQDLHVGGEIYKNGVPLTGDVSFANVGTTPSPKGATIDSQVITLQPADGTNPGLVSTGAQSFAGIKTFLQKVFFQDGIEVTGPSTIINATELEVQDAYLTLNKGGTNTSAENAGVEIERVTGGNAAIQFDSTLTSKWKVGIVGALFEVIVSGTTQVIGGLKTFSSLLTTSDILLSGKIFKGFETNTQAGTGIALTNPTKPIVFVTNAALVSIYEIATPASNSQTFILVNKTGNAITLLDSNDSAGISTGTDGNLTLLDGRTLYLVYDSIGNIWRVIGGSGTALPLGGTAGQILAKVDGVNYNATWTTLTKSTLGLGNVDNTSDSSKPVSTATQSALNLKQDAATAVTLTGTQTLTNKDIDGGTASNTSRITLPKAAKTTLDALTRKAGTIVFDTTTNKPYYDDGTTLQLVGSGSGGTKNYVTNGDAEGGSTGWDGFGRGTPATRPGSASGSFITPVLLTATTSSTAPLSGLNSWIISKPASNIQSHMIYRTIIIDEADKAKMMQISFDYKVDSGTFQAGSSTQDSDLIVYMSANNVFIEPSNIKLESNSTTLSTRFTATFQTDATSTSYRLCFYVPTTNTAAWTLKLDNIAVSPSVYVYGTPVTDWQSYTPTYTNLGTVITDTAEWRRVGDSIQLRGRFQQGTGAASVATISLPTGMTWTQPTSSPLNVGHSTTNDPSLFDLRLSGGPAASGTSLAYYNNNAALSATVNGNAFTANVFHVWSAQVKIQGWSSSVQMSDSASQSVVSFKGTGTSQAVTADTTNITFTATSDKTGSWNGTQFRVQTPGDYVATGSWSVNAASNGKVFLNGVQVPGFFSESVSGGITSGTLLIPDLKSGDLISFRSNSTGTLSNAQGSIFRLSGPSAIAASESVSALYSGIPTGTLANSFANVTTFPTKMKDTHSAYNSGTYRVPASGTYSVSAMSFISGTYGLNTYAGIAIFIDGVEKFTDYMITGGSNNAQVVRITTHSLPLLEGQLLTIRIGTSAGSPSFDTVPARHLFSIVRTGNY